MSGNPNHDDEGKFASGSNLRETIKTSMKEQKLADAKAKWQATEYNYAKNPINTMKVRRDLAWAAYSKLKGPS